MVHFARQVKMQPPPAPPTERTRRLVYAGRIPSRSTYLLSVLVNAVAASGRRADVTRELLGVADAAAAERAEAIRGLAHRLFDAPGLSSRTSCEACRRHGFQTSAQAGGAS